MRTWKWVLESAVTSILCWCEQRSSSRRQQGKNIFKTTIGAGGYTHKHTHKHTHTKKNKHTHTQKQNTHTHTKTKTHIHTHTRWRLNQIYWLVVSTPLKKIVSWDYSSQLNGKITKTCSKPTTSICIIVQYHISGNQARQQISWEIECPRFQCCLHHSALCGLGVTAWPQGQHVTQRHLWFLKGVPLHDFPR